MVKDLRDQVLYKWVHFWHSFSFRNQHDIIKHIRLVCVVLAHFFFTSLTPVSACLLHLPPSSRALVGWLLAPMPPNPSTQPVPGPLMSPLL